MMDLEREQFRKTYEVSRLGFAILSTALVPACFTSLLELLSCFHRELVLWMLLFCERTTWAAWPLRHRPIQALASLLLIHGSLLIWTITLLQVTALVIAATRQASHVLEEMAREDEAIDPLRSRSNPPAE